MTSSPHSLRLRWLVPARLAWLVLAAITLGLYLAGLPGRLQGLQAAVDPRTLAGLGLSAGAYATYVVGLQSAVVLVHLLMAAMIFGRRSADPMALFVSLVLVTNGALVPLSLMYRSVPLNPLAALSLETVIYLGLVSAIGLLYLFPTGHFVPRWTRPLAFLWALLMLPAIFWPRAPFSFTAWPVLAQLAVLIVASGSGLYAQLHRYAQVSSPLQRQQTKWAVLGLTAAALGPFGYFLPFVILPSLARPAAPNFLYQLVGPTFFKVSLVLQLVSVTLFSLVLLLFPLTFAIAVLRYRLWDIDVLINRTLVYGALTAIVALIYAATVVVLQAALDLVAGQQSQLAIVGSTLAIAAVFQPLRIRLHALVDRRFYRRKYDASRTLALFATRLRDEVDLERLSQALLGVVDDTMQPAHSSLWLKGTGRVPGGPAARATGR